MCYLVELVPELEDDSKKLLQPAAEAHIETRRVDQTRHGAHVFLPASEQLLEQHGLQSLLSLRHLNHLQHKLKKQLHKSMAS